MALSRGSVAAAWASRLWWPLVAVTTGGELREESGGWRLQGLGRPGQGTQGGAEGSEVLWLGARPGPVETSRT